MFDGSLKKPPLLNINEKLYPLLSNAEKSAMQGDIFKFYEQADKILPEIKNDLRGDVAFLFGCCSPIH